MVVIHVHVQILRMEQSWFKPWQGTFKPSEPTFIGHHSQRQYFSVLEVDVHQFFYSMHTVHVTFMYKDCTMTSCEIS